MRAVVQRVKNADVKVDGRIIGQIDQGLLVLIGIQKQDEKADIDYIVRKVLKLRVFEDEDGKMNKSVEDVDGQLLLVSQFTLLGDVRKGNRPSFFEAMPPNEAEEFYNKIIKCFEKSNLKIQCGEFGADMKVSLVNDGPVTILLDSKSVF